MKAYTRTIFCITLFIFLSACGSSDGDTSTPNPNSAPVNADAKGLWQATEGDLSFYVLITGDSIYAVSEASYQPNKPDEVGFGTYRVSENALVAEDMQYFSFADGVQTADIIATIIERESITGTATLENGTTRHFTLTYNDYFDETASLSSIVGHSRGETANRRGYDNTIAQIGNDGTFTGNTEDNCTYYGNLTANSDGNFFDMSLSSDNQCALSDEFNGVAFYDDAKNALYAMALNADGSEGIIYWGDIEQPITTLPFASIPRNSLDELSVAEGLWLSNSSNGRQFLTIVTDTGEAHVVYTDESRQYWDGYGFAQLRNTEGLSFQSTVAKDINFSTSGLYDVNVTGTVSADLNSISGIFTYPNNNQVIFSGSYIPVAQTPSLESLQGVYTGDSLFGKTGQPPTIGREGAVVNITSSGRFFGVGDSGCEATGVVTPRTRGNLYDISVTFTSSECLFENKTFTGLLTYHANTIYVATPGMGLESGLLFTATRN